MSRPSFQPEYRRLGRFNPDAKPVHSEEMRAAYSQIDKLTAALNECREHLETEIDVFDGDGGAPAPNRAMQLVCMIDQILYEPEPRR